MNIKSNRLWLGLAIVLVIIIASMIVLLQLSKPATPPPPLVPLPAEFTAAYTLWDKQHLTDYYMTVSLVWGDLIGAHVIFTVRNNKPTKAEFRDPGLHIVSPATTPEWYTKSLGKVFPPDLEDYTIDKLFDFAALKLQTQPSAALGAAHYAVTFDKEKGYLKSLTYDAYDECSGHTDSGTPIGCHATYYMSIEDLQSIN